MLLNNPVILFVVDSAPTIVRVKRIMVGKTFKDHPGMTGPLEVVVTTRTTLNPSVHSDRHG